MRNKNILKVLSLLAAVCITAGCNGSTAVGTTTTTTTTTAVECTTTVTISSTSEETDSEISASSQLEIDYVDDDGIIYYKNPTEWTFEKVFKELRINGQQFESPLTFDKLGEGFEFSDGEYDTTYSSSNGNIYKMLKLKDKYFCSVTFINCKDENDYNKPFHELELSFPGTNEEYRNLITINGIGIGSTVEETIEKLGTPCSRLGSSFIYTATNVKDNSGSISLAFQKEKLAVITIRLYDSVE